jgi:hypothetical protein
MSHRFFTEPDVVGAHAASQAHFKPKYHDIRFIPNAIVNGVPVEIDDNCMIVAVETTSGEIVRALGDYRVCRSQSMNWFIDREKMIHPLD